MKEYAASILPLNDLVARNLDLLRIFEKVVDDIEDQKLKNWIEEMIEHHDIFADELAFEVQKIGGQPSEKTSILGDLQRFWITLKNNVINRDSDKILDDCENMEEQIFTAYDKVLDKVTMPLSTTNVLRRHFEMIKKSIQFLEVIRKNELA